MLSVDEALSKILETFATLPAETIPVAEALGRVLAQDVIAVEDLPPFPNSSMDGYAVRAADVAKAGKDVPVSLAVVGDIPAGVAPQFSVYEGQAARIMTGAMMPPGADAVIPVEETDEGNGFRTENRAATLRKHIGILRTAKVGDYVRPIGEDIRVGQIVLHKRRVIRAADLGVIVGLGQTEVQVIQRAKVAILSTGDELLTADQPLEPGKIRDSNGYTISALCQQIGAIPNYLGIARDTEADVRDKLKQALSWGAHVILSTAGVSVGAFDVVRSVIESMGTLGFWKINLRPGKPLAFGNVGSVPYFGLPGNPVSAMVTFDVFARPAILKLMGHSDHAPTVEAELVDHMTSDGRRTYMRVRLERQDGSLIAHSTGTQSSGALSSMVYADGLMIVPEGMTDIPVGTRLKVRLLSEEI
ncbi:MAG: gephyrin-like molybdotransferase Glp [Anaerolineae bacterium]